MAIKPKKYEQSRLFERSRNVILIRANPPEIKPTEIGRTFWCNPTNHLYNENAKQACGILTLKQVADGLGKLLKEFIPLEHER